MGLLFAGWAAAEIASSERGPTVGLVSFGGAALWTARRGQALGRAPSPAGQAPGKAARGALATMGAASYP
jgi:hypothetical protein